MREFTAEIRRKEQPQEQQEEVAAPQQEYRGDNGRRAVAVLGLDALKLLMRLPSGVNIELAFQDDFDRANGIMHLVLSGADLPREFTLRDDDYPKRATFICTENGRSIPDWECQVLQADDE